VHAPVGRRGYPSSFAREVATGAGLGLDGMHDFFSSAAARSGTEII